MMGKRKTGASRKDVINSIDKILKVDKNILFFVSLVMQSLHSVRHLAACVPNTECKKAKMKAKFSSFFLASACKLARAFQ